MHGTAYSKTIVSSNHNVFIVFYKYGLESVTKGIQAMNHVQMEGYTR